MTTRPVPVLEGVRWRTAVPLEPNQNLDEWHDPGFYDLRSPVGGPETLDPEVRYYFEVHAPSTASRPGGVRQTLISQADGTALSRIFADGAWTAWAAPEGGGGGGSVPMFAGESNVNYDFPSEDLFTVMNAVEVRPASFCTYDTETATVTLTEGGFYRVCASASLADPERLFALKSAFGESGGMYSISTPSNGSSQFAFLVFVGQLYTDDTLVFEPVPLTGEIEEDYAYANTVFTIERIADQVD
jgi:hypothetical protein